MVARAGLDEGLDRRRRAARRVDPNARRFHERQFGGADATGVRSLRIEVMVTIISPPKKLFLRHDSAPRPPLFRVKFLLQARSLAERAADPRDWPPTFETHHAEDSHIQFVADRGLPAAGPELRLLCFLRTRMTGAARIRARPVNSICRRRSVDLWRLKVPGSLAAAVSMEMLRGPRRKQ